ncbi:hypothetical protein Tco_1298074 [Tanacetum coccineum]
MSTLLELSSIAKSIDLKDMMVVLFERKNEKDLITANNMNIIVEYLATRVRERDLLIGELDNCLGSTTAYESSKLLREKNDVDLVKASTYVVLTTIEKIETIHERLKVAQDRWKCYANNRLRPIEFNIGEYVMLKFHRGKVCSDSRTMENLVRGL